MRQDRHLNRNGSIRRKNPDRSAEKFTPMEALEQRALLSYSPLPSVAEMQNPSNTVVRFETNFGDVDIELFDTAAPITVANFLKYIRDGDYDNTIFHRLAKQGTGGSQPFVLQGGGYRVKTGNPVMNDNAFIEIPVDAPITNEYNQSNLTRTIAMARIGGQVNSATSQFFFNMANNNFLDTVDGGFTVFGRVLNDSSWNVLTTIDGLVTNSSDTNLKDFQAGSSSAFDTVPVTDAFNAADGIQASELIQIIDAEIIKPVNVAAFYQYRYYFPEGFAANSVSEFLTFINANSTTVHYQVIVRSEVAKNQPAATPGPTPDPDFWYRDKVVATDSVTGNRRKGVTISQAGRNLNTVERQTPFAYEVWATGPLGATLSHYANSAATGESFTDTAATTWTLVDLRRGGINRDFVLWQNIGDTTANITLTFYLSTGSQTFNVTTEAFRRGGFNVNNFGTFPDSEFSLRITSDVPIVVSRTHYSDGADPTAAMTLAQRGAGDTRGILPLANYKSANPVAAGEILAFFNPGNAIAIVTLIFSFDDGSPDITITPAQLFIQPEKRASYDLANVVGLDGKRFTVRYSSGSGNIFAETRHTERGDDTAVGFYTTASRKTAFADGFMRRNRAGNNLFSTISIVNPYSAFLGQTNTTANVAIRFIYNDGGAVITHNVQIDGGDRFDLDIHTFEPVLAASDSGRRFFTIEVVGDIPLIASFRQYDTANSPTQPPGGFVTTGLQRVPVAFADLAAAL